MRPFFSTLRLGQHLERDLSSEIETAERLADHRLFENIRDDVRDYFRRIFRISIFLSGLALSPLLIITFYDKPPVWLTAGYSFLLLALGILGIAIIKPVFSITYYLKKLPDDAYQDLVRPLALNFDVVGIVMNIGLLLYVSPRLGLSTSFPIAACLGLVWIFAPWLALNSEIKTLLLRIRVVQLVPLTLLTMVIVTSPVSFRKLGWWAQRETSNKMRISPLDELTEKWESLQWFTQEGEPNIWYSGDSRTGYKLYSAPGYDPSTNEEIKPVTNQSTKADIIRYLSVQKTRLENQRRIDSEKKEIEEVKHRKDLETASRNLLIKKYVYSSFEAGSDIQIPALVVLDAADHEDSVYEDMLSETLHKAGFNTQRPFTPSFISSQDFKNFLSGQRPDESSFHAEQFVKHILIIQKKVVPESQSLSAVDDLISVDITLSVTLISAVDGRIDSISKITARGIGFKESAAIKDAYEGLEGKLKDLVPKLLGKL
jgi:hypothetical protein